MHTSRPIEVDGRFVGVAVARDAGWRFLATDPALEDLQGQPFPSPDAAARMARLLLAPKEGRPS